ncbi:hypothetical protein jhhlp_004033 [Lomentospora prolificans]|uniref:Uncharacterized protein n=1 Tax=Lomentospora prolificans TaxID=41688 RepID=A0A2N3NAF6_9PEZI|nr:hypothetical protein jhhlp_004033 [Lomentospora prolificans]
MAASTEALSFSNLYPNRPIRPLPKRRLRERLSPEAAESIKYPPSTRISSIFYPAYPTEITEEEYPREDPPRSRDSGEGAPSDEVRQFVGATNGSSQNGADSEPLGDRQALRSAMVARPPPEIPFNRSSSRQAPQVNPAHRQSSVLPSADVSTDGYESYENTNNKKKRKIPTAGDSSLGSSHSNSDGSAVPISASLAAAHMQSEPLGNSQYGALHGSSVNNKGISGAGRGMFGRVRNGRSPLRTLSNANNWTERNAKPRPGRQWGPPSAEAPVKGIISSAIAKAGKTPADQGQENISLLQSPSVARSTPASTQFTFTCESQVPGTYRGDLPSGLPSAGYISSTKQAGLPHGLDPSPGHHDGAPRGLGPSATRQKKNRKSISRELDEQARQRRAKTQENRRRNPIPLEEEWVCDFCIYERIWGKPTALIRAYEERERRERIAEMNKKRRLEQVKARSRKSKKLPKNAGGKNGNAAKSNQDIPEHDTHGGVHGDLGSEEDDGTSEEYPDESFDPLDDVDDGEPVSIEGDNHNGNIRYDYHRSNGGGGGGGGRDDLRGNARRSRVDAQGVTK